MVISKERRKEEDPTDNIEKEGPERAGRDDREVEESDARVPKRCRERPGVGAEKDPLHLGSKNVRKHASKRKVSVEL